MGQVPMDFRFYGVAIVSGKWRVRRTTFFPTNSVVFSMEGGYEYGKTVPADEVPSGDNG